MCCVDADYGDAIVWERMRGGDIDAWGILFDRHAARVHSFCSRFLGNQDVGEEVLSDVFLEVWRARRSFVVRGGSAIPIVLAIARRACQKKLRAESRQARLSARMRIDAAWLDDVAIDVVEQSELERRRAWLRQEVAGLSTPYRDVFELLVYAELSHQEVSDVLAIPIGTVKSRMARARHIIERAAHDHDELSPLARLGTRKEQSLWQ